MGNLVLVYCIGKKVYGASVGILATLLLGISPSFFWGGNSILTEIPASFLELLLVYCALNRKYTLSGIVGTTAFFTKFTTMLALMAVGIFIALRNTERRTLRPAANYLLGCTVIFSMGMLCFFLLYGNISLPFAHAQLIYTAYSQLIFAQAHYSWSQGFLYVLDALPRIENWGLVFALANLFFVYRDPVVEKVLLLGLGLLQLAWIGKYPADVPRFLLMALPYLYLLTANGILQSYAFLRNKGLKILLVTAVLAQLGMQCYGITTMRFAPNQLTVFQRYIKSHEANIRGSIWISSPTMLAYSNLKAEERMYYPVFNANKISDLSLKLNQADFIFVESADLRCRRSDSVCRKEKDKLLEKMKQNFKAELYYQDPSSGRIRAVFKKNNS